MSRRRLTLAEQVDQLNTALEGLLEALVGRPAQWLVDRLERLLR